MADKIKYNFSFMFQKLHSRLGDFWWYSLMLFAACRTGDAIQAFIGLWLVPKYVGTEELGAVIPLQSLAGLFAAPLGVLAVVFASLTSGVADSGPASAGQRSQTQPVRPSGGGRSPSVRGDAPKPGEPGYREYRMRQYYDGMDAAVLEGDRKKTASGGASSAGEESAEMTSEGEAPESRTSIGDDAPVRKSSAMSDLSSSGAGPGFSSLDDGSSETVSGSEDYPFECMFVRAEKLRNGSRVSIRLLEDMVVGGTLIPKNTHLMAMCAISDRLQLTVSNVEMNQRIYSLGYEAYDTDGSRGIYCPDLTQQDRRKIESQGLSSVGGILGRRVGSLASSAVQTGVSIAQSRSGEVTVSVPAGYKFYIVKKRN